MVRDNFFVMTDCNSHRTQTLLLTVIILCFGNVNGLICLNCDGVRSPSQCSQVKTCAANQTCLVSRYRGNFNEILYRVGCTETDSCNNTINNPQGTQCKECCSTDLCNAFGCGSNGYSSKRGLICFDCNERLTPSSCNSIRMCAENEKCNVEEKQQFGNTIYKTSCRISALCKADSNPGAIGRRSSNCSHCCSEDLCNSNCFVGNATNITTPIEISTSLAPTASISVSITGISVSTTGASVPSTGTSVPSKGTSVPSTSTSMPTTRTSVPSTITSLPSAGTSVPSTGTSVPSKGTSVPSTSTSVPTTRTSVPSTIMPLPSAGTSVSSTAGIGKEFWFSFTKNLRHTSRVHLKLLVISESDINNITTEANNTIKMTNITNKLNVTVISMNYTMEQDANVIERKGVSVKSKDFISLYGYADHGGEFVDISWIPPIDSLGTEYIAASYHPYFSYYSFVSITAVDANTIVNVTLNTTGSFSYNGRTVHNGDTINLILNQFDTFQLSNIHDVTGTRINSSKPVLAQSGNVDIWVHNSGGVDCHSSIVLPPVAKWGKQFIVPNIKTATRMIIRVMPSLQHTNIQINGENFSQSYLKDTTLELNFDASKMFIVRCDEPCFITQFAVSETGGMVTCFMTTIPSVEQHSRSHHVISAGKNIAQRYPVKSHYISVSIPSNETNGLILDGAPVSINKVETKSLNVSLESWTVLTLPVPGGIHTLSHITNNSVCGAIAYGFGYVVSYAYAAGLNL